MESSIMATFDNPEWVHHVMESMLVKKLTVIERAGKIELDLVETGGGAGSSTVISPKLHREFCLPYDKKQHEALHAAGFIPWISLDCDGNYGLYIGLVWCHGRINVTCIQAKLRSRTGQKYQVKRIRH